MPRDREPRDTDLPLDSVDGAVEAFDDLDEDEDRTPRPVDLPGIAWRKAVQAKKLARAALVAARHADTRAKEVHLHLFGIEGQPQAGALARTDTSIAAIQKSSVDRANEIEGKLEEIGGEVGKLKFLQWKIVTSALVGGSAGAVIVQVILWALGKR